MVSALRQG